MFLSSAVILSALALALDAPRVLADDFKPSVLDTPQVLGLVADPHINRDSCGSARFGSRELWACRDSQPYDAEGHPSFPLYQSSASWTDFDLDGKPKIQAINGSQTGLLCYGNNYEEPFYPVPEDECHENSIGACPDQKSRSAIWPDSPPLVTSADLATGVIQAYTWITQSAIDFHQRALAVDPPTTLYSVYYDPAESGTAAGLPNVTIVQESFWTSDQLPYGSYGGVVADGIAYLYGQNNARSVGLARVPADQVTNKTAYEFYVNGDWTSAAPGVNDTGVNILNVSAGGQGTYYYSSIWKRFVWIGQACDDIGANFYITTSGSPQGPWAKPSQFYTGSSDDSSISYTLQAHPGLLRSLDENAIYLTWTTANSTGYYTPLVYVQWQ